MAKTAPRTVVCHMSEAPHADKMDKGSFVTNTHGERDAECTWSGSDGSPHMAHAPHADNTTLIVAESECVFFREDPKRAWRTDTRKRWSFPFTSH